MANGDLIKLGTFYLAGTKKALPIKPWSPSSTAPGTTGFGDIHKFNSGETIEIRNTDSDDAYKIQWREVNDGNKKLLISDRVLLAGVSWNDLNAQGLVSGKSIVIDGKTYKLRILTGGSNQRPGSDGYGGGSPTSNEWDRIITNEAGYSGLPTPIASDLDTTSDAKDTNSTHNKFWNWLYVSSFCQDISELDSTNRAKRGYASARNWTHTSATFRDNSNGWRPVLEVNNEPTVTLTSPTNDQNIKQGTDFTFKWTGNDPDGDVLTYTLQVGTSAGASNIYNVNVGSVTSKNGISTTWPMGLYYWRVIADDGKGGVTKSSEGTFIIYVTGVNPVIGRDGQGRTTYTFASTGAEEKWIVPAGVTKIKIEAWGAQGGSIPSPSSTPGGLGGYAYGETSVTPGETLSLFVGTVGYGTSIGAGGPGGFNGGGNGGNSGGSGTGGGGGGGASDVRRGGNTLAHRILVAAGGGGAAFSYSGGHGGGLVGVIGTAALNYAFGGEGGTQTTGGTGGAYYGNNGALGVGGVGAQLAGAGGGGGGGYYGGGGGGSSNSYVTGAGGGGGSSFTGTLSNNGTTAGQRTGHGQIIITDLNRPPTVTLTSPANNQTLTENSTYNVQGSATDVDSGNVVTVKYKINNGPTRALNSGVSNGSTPISFAKNFTFKGKRLWDGSTDTSGAQLDENVNHTLEVWAEDDQGAKSTVVTRTFKVIWNRPPVISDINRDLGITEAPPKVNYTVSDPEGNPFTITEKIGGQVIRTYAGVSGRQETITIPHHMWLRVEPGVLQNLTIEATDDQGLTSKRTYTLTRFVDKIIFKMDFATMPETTKKFFTTDVAAKRLLLTPMWNLPLGVNLLVEACNNGYDAAPTWEDATHVVKTGRIHMFNNTTKSADKWGINFRFRIEKGSAIFPVYFKGVGGAFD